MRFVRITAVVAASLGGLALLLTPSSIAPPPAPPPDGGGVRVLILGDMMFDRYIREVSNIVGQDFILSCIAPFLKNADLVVANLEGPITSNPSLSLGAPIESAESYTFTFPPETADLLHRHGIRAVNLGNNHSTNFGLEGLEETRMRLGAKGVRHFGGVNGTEPVAQIEVGGVALSLVSYNQFGGDAPAVVAERIAAEHAFGRRVIVYTHWGDEYADPAAQMRDTARLFVAAGASAVIGSHPHIVGSHERMGDAIVYYSLGNFIFDQYFSDMVTHGLALLMHIPKDPSQPISITEYPLILHTDGRTCLRETKE